MLTTASVSLILNVQNVVYETCICPLTCQFMRSRASGSLRLIVCLLLKCFYSYTSYSPHHIFVVAELAIEFMYISLRHMFVIVIVLYLIGQFGPSAGEHVAN